MKQVFLSTTFSGQVNDEDGSILPTFRSSIAVVLAALREQPGIEVFCAIEHENWKISTELPDKGVRKDIVELDAADIVIALLTDKNSAGVQFEIGYAVAKGKQVILAVRAKQPLAFFNEGLVGAGYVTLVSYDTPTALVMQLPLH